jgi:hypothetical protein
VTEGSTEMAQKEGERGSANRVWSPNFTVAISVLCSVLLIGLAGVLFVSDKTDKALYVTWWLAVAVTVTSATTVSIRRFQGSLSPTKGRIIVALISITAYGGAVALTFALR